MICPSAEGSFEQCSQLLAGTADSLPQGRPFVAYGYRLTACRSSLHEATLVGLARLACVLVAEVDFHPRDLIAIPAESGVDLGLDLTNQSFVNFDVGIRIDLDLHAHSPEWLSFDIKREFYIA